MKGIVEPVTDVSGNGSAAEAEAATPLASPAERTIVIVLAQVIVLIALIMIWRVLLSKKKRD